MAYKDILRNSLRTFEDLEKWLAGRKVAVDPRLKDVIGKYPMRVNTYYLSLIEKMNDGIWKQAIPSVGELEHYKDLTADPLDEDGDIPLGGPRTIIHRYPDRILLLISNECSMYCRFCTRKRKVGEPNKNPRLCEIREGINYIKEHEEIRDVILSGGDPLMLSDAILENIIREVHAIISHRENGIIRIGTRVPCVLPQRITLNLCEMLKKYHPLYINTHFNHPDEITPESKKACAMLADAGIPLGCQTVLLKGVNDNAETMKKLMQGLVSIRVKPYYIYQCDPVKGANHFRTTVEKGLEIYSKIRGWTSGLCVPQYVIDAPGGGGKVPILPKYLQSIDEEKIVMKNYLGNEHVYPQIRREVF